MRKALLIILMSATWCCSYVMAQQKTVTGRITDGNNNPLPNVTVLVRGSNNQVQTDVHGVYRIEASLGAVLVFRYVGFSPEERTVGNEASINVVLSESTSGLDEVVVTAYGVDRERKSLGYSTPTVTGAEVSQTQRESFFGGLQGRVPGLSINSTNGNPGSSAQIVLRGFVSISGDNNALIVVDGVPINNSTLNQDNLAYSGANRSQDYSNRGIDINPQDIESYTILKGPEATALYGNQGASGAIVITTKKGKAGRGTVSYNNSFRFDRITRGPERQTVYGPGSNGIYSGTTSIFQGPKYPEGTPLYDNINAFFQTGITQKHNLAIDGGSEKYTYRWNNEYTDTKGVIPTTSYKRFSTRLTGTAQISDLLNATTSLAYINGDNTKANKGSTGFLMGLMRFDPASDVRNWIDENGNRITNIASIYAEYDNPLWDVNKNVNTDNTHRVMANTNLQLKPTDWLTFTGIVAADIASTEGLSVYHAQSYSGSGSAATPRGGRLQVYNQIDRILSGSVVATARHVFGDFSNVYSIGGNFQDNNFRTYSQYGENLFDPNFYSINNTDPETQLTKLSEFRNRNVGAFAQAVIGYRDYLYLTLSGRVDGASRLMPNNPYFAYPSASLAFNFSDIEGFKEKYPWLTFGKLRGSLGITGKQPWRTYATKSNLEAASSTGGGFAYSYYGGNPDLKAETTKNYEFGTELQFLDNRFGVDFTYYYLLSEDQIILPRISYGSGFVLRMMNGGDVRNQGMEVQFKVNPLRKPDLNWDITFNYAHNRGKVLSIADELPELYDSDTWVLTDVRSAVHPGYSTGAISGPKFERNNSGQILIDPNNGLPIRSSAIYEYIGDRTPKFTLGMVNNFTYKSFNLSFLWDLRYGGDVMNGTEYELYTRGISTKTLDRETPRVINGVLKDGLENTSNPTVNTISVTPYRKSVYYTTNVEPGQFVEHDIKALRLRDITLSYSLPRQTITYLGFLQNLKAFVTLTDVVLFTNYTGLDPESNVTTPASGGIGGYGIDYGNIGRPLGFNLGISASF